MVAGLAVMVLVVVAACSSDSTPSADTTGVTTAGTELPAEILDVMNKPRYADRDVGAAGP